MLGRLPKPIATETPPNLPQPLQEMVVLQRQLGTVKSIGHPAARDAFCRTIGSCRPPQRSAARCSIAPHSSATSLIGELNHGHFGLMEVHAHVDVGPSIRYQI